MWSSVGSFSIARRGALLCGQVHGTSLWSGVGHICVDRLGPFLCGQVRGHSVWSGAGYFFVARRGAILCGQAQCLSLICKRYSIFGKNDSSKDKVIFS